MDGPPPEEEDFSQIPLAERSQHKNWKARVSAYTDVIAKSAKTASDTDPFFRPYTSDGGLLRKWCTDANAVAQEKGIEAVLAIAQYSGESSARSDVIPALVEKALGAPRAGTKKKAIELAAMFVEVENTGEGVMTDLFPGLDAKQPKVVAGCITCLKEIIEQFGIPTMGNIKPLMKLLPKMFGHSDKTVRAEATSLVLTLYTYLGAAIQPSLADLKPVQLAELQKSFDAMDGEGKGAATGKPARFTRKVQREQEASAGADSGDGGEGDGADAGEAEPAAPIDPRDLLDPVDVYKLFPADLDERLASSKWKDRFESLEEVNKVLCAPANAKISEGNLDACGSLATTLGAKCKSDANINVVIEAAKVIEALANGLGKPFGRYRGAAMVGMLERLKERKASVVEPLGKALDAVFATVPFSEIVDDILASTKSKNPQVKEGTLRFLQRSLLSTTDLPSKDQIKPLAEALVALLGDSAEAVRTGAADCLGTMMKLLGERTFNPYIENVGELQMGKVRDAFGKAEVKYKAGGAKVAAKPAGGAGTGAGAGAAKPVAKKPILSSAKPKPAAAAAPSGLAPGSPPIRSAAKSSMPDEFPSEAAPPKKGPPASVLARLGAAKAAPAVKPSSTTTAAPAAAPAAARKPAASSSAGPSKTLAASPSDPVKYRYSNEEAMAKAQDMIPAEFHTNLADGAWKIRLEAAEEMIRWAEENADKGEVESEVVFRFLGKVPGWGEKNFQVSSKLYDVMRTLADKSPSFGKPSAALAIGPLSEKLGDMKLKKPAGDALVAFAEKTSFAFVLAQAYEPLTKVKAPKAQADALTWIKATINEFGIAGIPLRDLIGFVKAALGNANALVRSSATHLLVAIRVFVGADISGFLEDVNPQLLNTINTEFEKASSQTAPEPTRTQADLQEAAPGKGGKAAAGGADPLDDLIPRVDLDKLVNQTSVVKDSKSDAWKVRKEAFEALSALLEVKSNSRLKPNMGDIAGVLKKAMADTNLAVKMLALGIITKIATGMGQPFDKQTRILTSAVASVCADQKVTTRSAAIATLAAMADAAGGLETLYAGLATALESPNPALRASVLGWLAERMASGADATAGDMSPLAAPVLSCLEDRNGDVRKGAGAVLPFVVASAGYEYVMSQTTKLKPASKATIVPLIQKAKETAAASAPAPAPAVASAMPSKTPVAKLSRPGSAAAERSAPPSPAPGPTKAAAPGIPKPAARSAIPAPGRSLAMKSLGNAIPRPPSALSDDKPTGLARPKVLGQNRPTASAPAPPSTISNNADKVAPFITSDSMPRSARLKRDAARWLLEPSPKSDLVEYLSAQMEAHTSTDTYALLFSKDHRAEEDHMAALSNIAEFYDETDPAPYGLDSPEAVQAVQSANVDLAVKYAALKLLSNNTQLANRCLEVIASVLSAMRRLNERFSDVEAKLFAPALVFKLGDAKFVPKLLPIFDQLDKVIAGSQVVQLLVQYGLEDKSAGKTCKNESLALIEKAYRKRGSVLRVGNDRAFYEALAKCVGDSGTRNAALSVMALLQMQGASKNLEAVIEGMPASSRDMLANRRAALGTAKGAPAPLAAKVVQDSAIPSPRRKGDVDTLKADAASPKPKMASPQAARSIPAPTAARSGIPTSGILRPSSGIPSSRVPAPVQAPRDVFAAARPPPVSQRHDREAELLQLVNAIRDNNLDAAVDALKALQEVLSTEPEVTYNIIRTLVDTLVDEMAAAFSPPEQLNEGPWFRLVKHLIQTISCISANETLLRRLEYDDIYAFLDCLTLHLVQSEMMGGHFKELSKFINLILIQVLSQTDRLMIFKAMFKLLYALSVNFERDGITDGTDRAAAHADLVIKCLWKRCKVLDDDFRSGRLPLGATLVVVEEFLSGIGPTEWRKRAQTGIALGDMPLRTIKTIIQRAVGYCKRTGVEIYDILVAEFGDKASDTIVYSYVFRLWQAAATTRDESDGRAQVQPSNTGSIGRANGHGMRQAPGSSLGPDDAPGEVARRSAGTHSGIGIGSRPCSNLGSEAEGHAMNGNGEGRSSTPGSDSARMTPQASASSSAIPTSAASSSSRAASDSKTSSEAGPSAVNETEAIRLVRSIMRATGARQVERLDDLHAYMTANAAQEAEVQHAMSTLLSPPVQTYIRRALETRAAAALSPSKHELPPSPAQGPSSPSRRVSDQERRAARRSLAPRPSSVAVDKTAPPEAQLANYKNLFFSGAASGVQTQPQSGIGGMGAAGLRSSQSIDLLRGPSPASGLGNGRSSAEGERAGGERVTSLSKDVD